VCFYIYAPKSAIEVEFASESISLTSRGSGIIVADLLIKNASPDAIKSLYVIYPNRFITTNRWNQYKPEQIKDGFLQCTEELLDPANPVNRIYTISGHDFIPDVESLKIIKPNPDKPSEPKTYVGEIIEADKDEFRICPKQTDKALIALAENFFTAFVYTFSKPLENNKARWIRLLFRPRRTAFYFYGRGKEFILWMINSLRYSYQLMGPFDVLRLLQERISIMTEIVDKKIEKATRRGNSKYLKDLNMRRTGYSEIQREILQKILPEKTVFHDFSLHIFPRKLRLLQSIYVKGDITPNGSMPNYLWWPDDAPSVPSWKARVYDWSAEKPLTSEHGRFDIFFTGFVENRLFKFFLWIVLLQFLAEKALLPLAALIAGKIGFENLQSLLTRIETWLFHTNQWIPFWVSVAVGLILTLAMSPGTRLLKRFSGLLLILSAKIRGFFRRE